MPQQEIAITSIGAIAQEKLSEEPAASVMGTTSRGLFLQLSSGWVIFITPEAYHGPLTLNYLAGARERPPLAHGTLAEIQTGDIIFPHAELVIHTARATSWKAPDLPRECLPPDERMARLIQTARQMLAQRSASSLGALLPAILGFESRLNDERDASLAHLERVERSLRGGGIGALVESLQGFLGLGSGLTPSGDDLVMGVLLALARWKHVLAADMDIIALAEAFVPLAYRKTTTLSANLIECALRGQANERLLLALDGFMSGNPEAPACTEALAGWGNTSGLDALLGMALALKL